MSPNGELPRFEYKVLSERDKAFSGNFDLEGQEKTLNDLAGDGWRRASSPPASGRAANEVPWHCRRTLTITASVR